MHLIYYNPCLNRHRSGYCPYPAGGLCYKDGRMRYMVTWTSPIVFRDSEAEDSIGVYGVEGSKPGATVGKCSNLQTF